MDALLQNFFKPEVYRQVLPFLLGGLWTTVWLSLLVIPIGVASGLLLALLATQSRSRTVRIAVAVYVDFFRSFPPLVLLILIYFGAPFLGLEREPSLAFCRPQVVYNFKKIESVPTASVRRCPPAARR